MVPPRRPFPPRGGLRSTGNHGEDVSNVPFHRMPSPRASKSSSNSKSASRPARTEPLEARCLMHGGHEHFGSAAAANPAGSIFVDAGNVKTPFVNSVGVV